MDIQWVRLVSWHALRPKDHADTTYCGRSVVEGRPVSDELPSGKSCESCARIVLRLADDSRETA